jgi:hypothetical protein
MPMKAAETSSRPPSFKLKLGGTIARTLFILLFAVLTARVASPQIETLRSLLETPDDLIRVLLGFAVCVWCVINLFVLPRDAEAYRDWLYLGLAILPLSVLCAVVVW